MTEQEFNDKYKEFLQEFNDQYHSSNQLHDLLHDESFTMEFHQAKSSDEKMMLISAKLFEAESNRTNQLVRFMLKKFLDIRN